MRIAVIICIAIASTAIALIVGYFVNRHEKARAATLKETFEQIVARSREGHS